MASLEHYSVYSKLHEYSFLEDKQFLSGWTTVREGLADADQNTLAQKFLEAKVFYFSKFVEDVSLKEYIKWLEKHQGELTVSEEHKPTYKDTNPSQGESSRHQEGDKEDGITPTEETLNLAMEANTHMLTKTVITEGQLQDSQKSDQILEISKDNGGEEQANEAKDIELASSPQYPESFQEIIDMVQKGLPLPGVEDLNIEPTNTPPTKPCASRLMKPWEKD